MAPKLLRMRRSSPSDTTWESIMLSLPRFWAVASRFPFLFRGDTLHHAALRAVFARRFQLADRLFEAAVTRYRADLEVQALARLRIHQLIARAQAAREHDRDAALEMAADIERRLRAIDHLEDLAPPYAMVEAEGVRAEWSATPPEGMPAAA